MATQQCRSKIVKKLDNTRTLRTGQSYAVQENRTAGLQFCRIDIPQDCSTQAPRESRIQSTQFGNAASPRTPYFGEIFGSVVNPNVGFPFDVYAAGLPKDDGFSLDDEYMRDYGRNSGEYGQPFEQPGAASVSMEEVCDTVMNGPFSLPTNDESQAIIRLFEKSTKDFEATNYWAPVPSGIYFGGPEDKEIIFVGNDGKVHIMNYYTREHIRQNNFAGPGRRTSKIVQADHATNYALFNDKVVAIAGTLVSDKGRIVSLDTGHRNLRKSQFRDPIEEELGGQIGTRTSCQEPPPAQHIPRPQNAFILFRNSRTKQVKMENPGIGNNDISRVAGRLWRNADDETKAEYKAMAAKLAEAHRVQHPNYRYAPRKPSQISRRRKAYHHNIKDPRAKGVRKHAAHDNRRTAQWAQSVEQLVPAFVHSTLPQVAHLQAQWVQNPNQDTFNELMDEYDNISGQLATDAILP